MRKINTRKFRRATRDTPREINRRIALNVIRDHEPISRADLARRMQVSRSMISVLVDDLLAEGVIREGATANTARGRKPRLLHVRTHDRLAVAVDVRLSRTHVALMNFETRQLAAETFPTPLEPQRLVEELAARIDRMLEANGARGECEGVGIVIPGMVDRKTGRVLNSPQLGWRDVDIREALAAATGMRVFIENAPISSALAHMWLSPMRRGDGGDNLAYVAVSDGVGVGLVLNGEVLRGHGETAGEFGHLPLNLDGPRCLCGLRGCWEAYTSNVATLARYFHLDPSDPRTREHVRERGFGLPDLIERARAGDDAAHAALEETGRYLGIGLAGIVSAVNPARIIVGGEITAAWDLIGWIVEHAARERALTAAAAATPIVPAPDAELTRLRGATALLVARSFAAPKLA